ncbi:hypothetical protein, partial [Tenacibaculum maritimum]|uniref:hypothetical protein n=1 Tax=Tenacibaculum maritimum TaxID=107401 RepID=UPI00132F731F
MEYLKKIIIVKPREIKTEHVESNNNFIEETSDLYYRVKITARGWVSWSIGAFLIFLYLFMVWGENEEEDYLFKIAMITIFGLPGVLT